jgi:NADH:ubiquinone oxidoreductase subunit 6 (subunit J)
MTSFSLDARIKAAFQSFVLVGALMMVFYMAQDGVSFPAMAKNAYENIASVSSMSAAVPPSEYSYLAMQFAQKEGELTSREQALIAREQAFGAQYQEAMDANKRLTLFVLGGVTILLLSLILANFYLDAQRGKGETKKEVSHDHAGEFTTRL